MVNHYETLGVQPEADAREIKRAYRRRAEKAHPDKRGGDVDEMVAINRAFDVLGDPKRRLLYDATGQDSLRPIDEQVRALLMQGFQQALQQGSETILKDVRAFVKDAESKTVTAQVEGRKAIKELQKRRKEIKAKGENLFQVIVDVEVKKLEQQVAMMDEGLKVATAALKALDEYESDEKEPELRRGMLYSSMMNSATTGSW